MQASILVLVLILINAACGDERGSGVLRPEEYVNVKIGAISEQRGQRHSTGNTLPLVAVPWGFNHWAPQTTKAKNSWFSDMDSDTVYGIRCTHQPSPWMGDWAWFLISPFFGGDDGFEGYTSFLDQDSIRPWKMDITVSPYGTRMEFAPTNHGGVVKVSFSKNVPADRREICTRIPRGDNKGLDEMTARRNSQSSGQCSRLHDNGGGIGVISRRFSDGVPKGAILSFYAWLQAENSDLAITEQGLPNPDGCFDKDEQWTPLNFGGQERTTEDSIDHCQSRCRRVSGCAHFTFWSDGGCHIQDNFAKKEHNNGVTSGPAACPVDHDIRHCCFKLGDRLEAEIKIGTSFISFEQAEKAMRDEVGGKRLDSVAKEGQLTWRSMLQRIDVLDAGPPVQETWQRLQVFYTSLYRVLLFPRRLDENTPQGVRHWSPYDGQIHDGIGVTDNGFWDTFRTVYPLLTLAYPKELGELLDGWLNAFRTGGWLPKWASPSYRDSMIGTYADVTLADAIVKNISGFDRSVAWEAIKKDAYSSPPDAKDTSKGKFGLDKYRQLGYIPIDAKIGEACSRTLDFAFADAASAEVAKRLGHQVEAEELDRRSEAGLRSLFRNGLMARRTFSGYKEEPPDTWGDCFCEGSAWHHSFPPFNLGVLADLHGGKAVLLRKLHELFDTPATLQAGSYKVLIHEMREMRMIGMGQYAHNNQPSHHLPYLFAQLGEPAVTARLVRRIMSHCYSQDGFSGDEDNGEMGAWYVLSALGLFATALGVSENYVLGAVPLFPRILLRDLNLLIEAPKAPDKEPLADRIFFDGALLNVSFDSSIPYSKLRKGGTLLFASEPEKQQAEMNPQFLAKNGEGRSLRALASEYGNPEHLLIYWACCIIIFGGVAASMFFCNRQKAKIRESNGRRPRPRRHRDV